MDKRKLIAPVIITIIVVAYYAFFAFAIIFDNEIPNFVKVWFGFGAIPLLLAGVCIAMFWERFKEIKDGEEDDLGKY